MFVVFESNDIQGGSYPYGTIEVYHSLMAEQLGVILMVYITVHIAYLRLKLFLLETKLLFHIISGGNLWTSRFGRSNTTFSSSPVPVPTVSTDEFVVDHRMVSDVEDFSTNNYIYMAFFFKQADGKNRVLFSMSNDTADTWESFTKLGLSQSELGTFPIGLDYSSSGLYLAYLGADTSAGSILMRKSTNFGTSWTPEIKLPMFFNGGLNKKVGPMISAIGSRVAVIYQYDYFGDATDWKTGSDFDIYAIVSSDGGVSWEERMVGSTLASEILPSVTCDYDENFYVSYIRDGRVRVSMAGQEYAFGAADSSLIANTSLDDFTSIYGSTVPFNNTAYTTWTEVSNSNGLDILGALTTLKIPPISPTNLTTTVVSNTEIKLTWTDNSSDESGFAIYYRQAGTADLFEKKGTVGTGATTFTAAGLTPSMGYEFYVRAFNTNGYSLRTNIETAIASSGTAIPTISDFNPKSGPVGTTVMINSTGFSSMAANNIVYFGLVRASVINSTSNTLTGPVPVGASYHPLSINVGGLQAFTAQPFLVTFLSNNQIDTTTYKSKVDFATGSYPTDVSAGDLDGDGRLDMAITNFYSNTISVLRNTSTSGSISFASKLDFTTGISPEMVFLGDIDGDGMLDLVVTNYEDIALSVLRNTSTSGNISFAVKQDFTTGLHPDDVSLGDVDGDGKPDIVVTVFSSNAVSVFRNTSTIGNVSFASKQDFTTGSTASGVSLGDVDGDGKLDMVVTCASDNSVSIWRNTSETGNISFASHQDFYSGIWPFNVPLGDIDGDGKIDIITVNLTSNTVSVLRNTSTSGSITNGSLAVKQDFTTATNPFGISLADVDGDRKPDFVVTGTIDNMVSVFRNMSTIGNISFSSKQDFKTKGNKSYGVCLGDIDGDGKPDLAIADCDNNIVTVFRNTISGSITIPTPPNIITVAVINSNQIDISWQDNSNDEDGFRIERKTGNSGTYTEIKVVGNATTLYQDYTVSANTQYYYRVRAYNGAGYSAYSNEANATTPAVISAPAAPRNLTAVPENGRVTLTWNRNLESDFLKYRIYYGTTISSSMTLKDSTSGSAADTTKTITGLTNGTAYSFRITAVNNAGVESEFSNEANVTIPIVSTAPTAPRNLAATPGNGKATLIWNRNLESDFLKYRIYYGTTISSSMTLKDSTFGGAADTTKTITSLTNGTAYSFRITAVNNTGVESGFSNAADATPNAPADNTPPTIILNAPSGTPVSVNASGQVSTAPQVSATAADGESGVYQMQVAYRNTSEQTWSYSPRVNARYNQLCDTSDCVCVKQ